MVAVNLKITINQILSVSRGGKLWPMGQIWPPTYFLWIKFYGNIVCLFIYIFSRTALMLQQQTWVTETETGPQSLKYLLTSLTSPYPRRRQWHPTPALLPGKSHGRRSLVGCSPWDHWELDTTEWLHFHFSLSCIGEGNGNPLQCSCLENPRDGGVWWAAIYGVAQSWTRLKWLSSSSSISK